ncbi:hypothetical protein [Weeksella virosa]|uniref:Transcription elongation factor n=1 Tax=Weeksella virosa (strain ATCC 43766 / DSM 16922 / JCM 21250 / CCUG 30538 / CDC 9751 / IAM 14551 / NBRC 16016 / NCTC 11634 / CL345/78) TaxID=865938 RepID=F0P0A0_WEEVC|nr:hypothetical protein [Weeksella virosa]ADX68460.1 hypothetical protein Weevi_1769 [Weeksella virosa DSM 16922]VEH63883.1 Uncharacterised protein [Weeksella virosa]
MEICKDTIIEELQNILLNKLNHYDKLIADLRASNTDTKSSMGDKYETFREMLNQEINHLLHQKKMILAQQQVVENLTNDPHSIVDFGSFVVTDFGNFYISTSLGEVNFNGIKFITISQQTPLANALIGLKENQTFEVNQKKYTIQAIY